MIHTYKIYILKYTIYTNSDSKRNPCITRRQGIIVSVLPVPETGTSSHSHIAKAIEWPLTQVLRHHLYAQYHHPGLLQKL